MKKLIIAVAAVFALLSSGYSQKTDTVLYKQIDTTKLFVEVIYAKNVESNAITPAMVFYFGGGWVRGDRNHFRNHAEYFAQRGLTCFLVDYRTSSKNNTSPFECVKDAKSAMRFIKANAKKFHIDSSKVIASGGSAGGHLAASTAFISQYNHPEDNMLISPVPAALMLFNPVFDNGPGGYGYDRIGDAYKTFSPLHNIKTDAPPTIVFLGTEDPLIPVETAEYFKMVMEKTGSRCDLHLYEGQSHGFFNHGRTDDNKYYKLTVIEADKFLQSLGYLSGEHTVK